MNRVLFSVTMLLVSLFFEYGHATFECKLPAYSSMVYFDLEQLSLLELEEGITQSFKSPITCVKENEKACDEQLCCPGEVGCCYTNPINHIHKCGCKDPNEKYCTHPAPLAIMVSSNCEAYEKRNVSICFREKRGHIGDYIFEANSTLQNDLEIQTIQANMETPLLNSYQVVTTGNKDLVDHEHRLFLKQFSIDQLAVQLAKIVIDELIQTVAEEKV